MKTKGQTTYKSVIVSAYINANCKERMDNRCGGVIHRNLYNKDTRAEPGHPRRLALSGLFMVNFRKQCTNALVWDGSISTTQQIIVYTIAREYLHTRATQKGG